MGRWLGGSSDKGADAPKSADLQKFEAGQKAAHDWECAAQGKDPGDQSVDLPPLAY
jgi:hypothetical protein